MPPGKRLVAKNFLVWLTDFWKSKVIQPFPLKGEKEAIQKTSCWVTICDYYLFLYVISEILSNSIFFWFGRHNYHRLIKLYFYIIKVGPLGFHLISKMCTDNLWIATFLFVLQDLLKTDVQLQSQMEKSEKTSSSQNLSKSATFHCSFDIFR